MSHFFLNRKSWSGSCLIASALLCMGSGIAAIQIIGPLKVDQMTYDSPVNIMGSAELSRVKAPALTVSGPLAGEDIHVTGALVVIGPLGVDQLSAAQAQVVGPLSGDGLEFGRLDLTGPMNVSHLTIHGLCQVTGPVAIRNGRLDRLEVMGDEVDLEDVDIAEVVFKKTTPPTNAPRLILRGSSTIMQRLSFESGDGQVKIVGPTAQIKGKVEGATPFEIPEKTAAAAAN